MKLLFCCRKLLAASGEVQEVMRQIAERMAASGHDVSVATRVHPDRKTDVHDNVPASMPSTSPETLSPVFAARRVAIAGSSPTSTAMRSWSRAAQQWSFDALWPVVDQIKVRKVFVPCGFSSFYEPSFKNYFRQLPDILRKFDHLIFYAERYRDVDFARANGITHFSIIPNGASESSSDVEPARTGVFARN